MISHTTHKYPHEIHKVYLKKKNNFLNRRIVIKSNILHELQFKIFLKTFGNYK